MNPNRIVGIAMNDDRPEDLAARLAKVESELARVKSARDMAWAMKTLDASAQR